MDSVSSFQSYIPSSHDHLGLEVYLLFVNRKGIHPAKSNMKPKYEGFLFNWVMFKFHVNFQGCTRNGSSRDFSVMLMHICSDFYRFFTLCWDDNKR